MKDLTINKTIVTDLFKSKPLPVGTVKNWNGIDYKKIAEGQWIPLKKLSEAQKANIKREEQRIISNDNEDTKQDNDYELPVFKKTKDNFKAGTIVKQANKIYEKLKDGTYKLIAENGQKVVQKTKEGLNTIIDKNKQEIENRKVKQSEKPKTETKPKPKTRQSEEQLKRATAKPIDPDERWDEAVKATEKRISERQGNIKPKSEVKKLTHFSIAPDTVAYSYNPKKKDKDPSNNLIAIKANLPNYIKKLSNSNNQTEVNVGLNYLPKIKDILEPKGKLTPSPNNTYKNLQKEYLDNEKQLKENISNQERQDIEYYLQFINEIMNTLNIDKTQQEIIKKQIENMEKK